MQEPHHSGPTGEKIAYVAATLLGVVSLILLATDMYMANSNRTLQGQISANQSALVAGQTFSQINQNLVQALAEASIKNNDSQIRELLASQNITAKATPPEPKKSESIKK